MDTDTIIESTKENIKIITFNKPRRKNALDSNMYLRVANILNDAATNRDVSIVVLTGSGDFYSSGNDIFAVKDVSTSVLLPVLRDFIKAFITFPKLLVAIVNGPAVGVAVTTLPLCDFVIASESAYFYTPFTRLEIVAEACSSITFPRLIGQRKAMELLLLNYKMPAKEALECGLISYMFKPEDLQREAWEKITEISSLSQESVLATKKLMRRPYINELLETNEVELEELLRMFKIQQKSRL